jgi:hypothetical protein
VSPYASAVDAARLPVQDGTGEAGWVARWSAIALAAITLTLLVATVPLANSAGMHSTVGLSFLFTMIAFVVVGVVLTRTRPRNPIGWTMLAGAFFGGMTAVAGPYVVDAYRLHHHLPLAPVAVLFQPSWAPAIFLTALAIMLFPDGALPSGRWRWAVGFVAVVGAVWMLGAFAIAAETIYLHQVVIEPSGDLTRIDHPTSGWAWWSTVQGLFFLSFLVVLLLWLVSRVPAYRAASGERREQLKWLIAGGSVACIGVVLSVVLSDRSGLLGTVSSFAIIGLLGIPISIGVGVTKYRLYDIDRLISRTVSYTLLTGALLAVFVGVVLLTTRVLPFSSPVGVATSTLAVAALFSRLRLRLQRLVDSRFNRGRYDAEALVAEFSARLRNAVDPDTVRHGLLETAAAAVEPTHLSLWLRDDFTSR